MDKPRWTRVRDASGRVTTAYRNQVAKRADINGLVAMFVPASAVIPDAENPTSIENVEPTLTAPFGVVTETSATPIFTDNNNQAAAKPSDNSAVPHWLRVVAGWSWRLIILAAAIWLLAYVVGRLRMVFIALFLGLVLCSVLRPLRKFYDRYMKRGLAVLCSLLTAALVVAALLGYVVASVAHSWESVGKQFGTGVQKLIDLLRGPPFRLNIPYDHVGDAIHAGQTWLSEHYSSVAERVMASAGTAFETIATIALSIFLCAFFLSSGRQMWHWILSQFPKRMQHKLSVAFGTGFVTFAGYARGEVLISICDGILAAILLTALRIPLAIPLAVLVFIGAFIPMIGAPAAMLIAGVVALAADGPVKALIVILGVALIGQIEGHLLQPFLMGHQVNLHPVVIALAVASGTVLAGILGAVLSVPLVAVVWRVYQQLRPGGLDQNPQTQEQSHHKRKHHHGRLAHILVRN